MFTLVDILSSVKFGSY